MKRIALIMPLFAVLFFACSGEGEGNGKSGDENGKKEKEAKKEEKKEKEDEHEAHHQQGGPDDYSGEYRAGVEGADLESFDGSDALLVSELQESIGDKDSLDAKVKGEVTDVCPKKGCWMKMDMGDEEIMVRFKDYSFFVPKSSAGSHAVLEGIAFRDTMSVDELKHYAEDAGKSEEEIEAIKEPEVRLAFKARKVLLKEKEEGEKKEG